MYLNGKAPAFQAGYVGSIPITCSKQRGNKVEENYIVKSNGKLVDAGINRKQGLVWMNNYLQNSLSKGVGVKTVGKGDNIVMSCANGNVYEMVAK